MLKIGLIPKSGFIYRLWLYSIVSQAAYETVPACIPVELNFRHRGTSIFPPLPAHPLTLLLTSMVDQFYLLLNSLCFSTRFHTLGQATLTVPDPIGSLELFPVVYLRPFRCLHFDLLTFSNKVSNQELVLLSFRKATVKLRIVYFVFYRFQYMPFLYLLYYYISVIIIIETDYN